MNDEFEQQYQPLEKPLYLTAMSYVRNAEDAKDMVQEAALGAYQAYAGLRHKEYFKTWMTRILINKCLDFLKQEKTAASNERVTGAEQLFSELPAEELELMDAVFRLPDSLRPYIVLRFYHSFTYQEVARTLGTSQSLAKYRTKSALRKLREMLEEIV